MLDLSTLVIALTATYLLLTILFFLMTAYINGYRGIRMWAYGALSITLGFVVLYLRMILLPHSELVLLTNLFHLGGIILFYLGSRKVLGLPLYVPRIVVFFGAYLFSIACFTYAYDSLQARVILFSASVSGLLFYNAYILIRFSEASYRKAARLLANLFILIAAFFALRIAYTAFFPFKDNDFFHNNDMQSYSLLLGLCVSILWTLGIIVLQNQKLQADVDSKNVELADSNQDKDRFFSILAHDLKGPVSTLAGFTEILMDASFSASPEKMREIAQAMNQSAQSTKALLENLLDWGRLQRSATPFHPETMLFNELIPEIMGTLSVQSDKKHITICNNIPLETVLDGDRHMVQSIFRNLLSNAIKFTPHNGTIDLNIRTENGGTIYSIHDTGIGMSAEMVESLLEQRESNNRKGTAGETGTGLGLLLCKEFIEKHGGRLWIDSQNGAGSTFHFTLTPGTGTAGYK